MGRGRVTLKRIENKINRQVCFSKRRSGLMKKAHEISVLCDADVGLIVFSTKGKIAEYASNSSMVRILERYERHTFTKSQHNGINHQSQASWMLEQAKLKARIELLQKTHRNLMGEDLDSLSLKDLQNLEQQIETALRRLRSRKNQRMLESVSELQKQDKALQDQNRLLLKEIKEKEEELAQPPLMDNQTHENIFPFHPLNLRYSGTYQARDNEAIQETKTQNRSLIVIPHWMLQHMSK